MDYSITYFGSSKTKSTNEFRNHTGIILLGDWNIPYTFANSVEEAFLSETTLEDYRMWYYTQLLSRIGIRNFDGGEYDVWYSSDYNLEFINCNTPYLNYNIYNPIGKAKHKSDWLAEKAGTFRIRKEIVADIQKLVDIFARLVGKVFEDSRVKVARSRTHRHAAERCKAHRSIYALAVFNRGNGRTVAEVAGDDFKVVSVGVEIFCGFFRNKAVGSAVRAVATNFILRKVFVRNSESISVIGHGRVESRVERYRHRNVAHDFAAGINAHEVCFLVERRKVGVR